MSLPEISITLRCGTLAMFQPDLLAGVELERAKALEQKEQL